MIRKRLADLAGRNRISGFHRGLLVALLIGAWQLIALDRYNINNGIDLRPEGTIESAERLVPRSRAMEFEATAYCDYGITKSGVETAPGVAAADPSVLPLGSLVFV